MSRSRNERVRQGPIEIDFEESTLIVNCEVEETQTNEHGVQTVISRRPMIKRIKIKALSPDKSMAQLATDIVGQCKYIDERRVEEVEQLLIRLRRYALQQQPAVMAAPAPSDSDMEESNRKASSETKSAKPRDRDRDRDHDRNRDRDFRRSGGNARSAPELPEADINALDDYLEMLYEVASNKSEKEAEQAIRKQERATLLILQLCREVMNLEQIIQNNTLMSALTRTLEENKVSIDLSFNIIRIFLAFSNFNEMHPLMSNFKIGILTMRSLELELKRLSLRETEKLSFDKEISLEISRTKKSSDFSSSEEKEQILEKLRIKREKENLKFQVFVRKQEKLFFVGFYVLLNLAEDISVERKMIKKGLITMLTPMLNTNHTFENLLRMVVTFLHKLSLYEENKNVFKELHLVTLLLPFLSCSSKPLTSMTLKLLFNLSFDREIRAQMLTSNYIPKILVLIPNFGPRVMKLLYHLTVDDKGKEILAFTDNAVSLLMDLVIQFPHEFIPKELAAVMINISYHPKVVELMLNNRGLNLLMDRYADHKKDVLLLKIIRNVSLWTFNQQQEAESPELTYRYRGLWSPHIKILLEILLEENNAAQDKESGPSSRDRMLQLQAQQPQSSCQDVIIEIIGTLANMTVYDLPATSNWSRLLKDYQLINFFMKFLVTSTNVASASSSQNDLILEIIMLITSVATDQQACSILAQGNLIPTLYQLIKEKAEDVEIVLQLLNCFDKLLYTQATREVVMYNTRIFTDIIECLTHRNSAIRTMAAKMSEFVLEHDRKADGTIGSLGKQVIKRRFESYNKLWLSAVNLLDLNHPGSDMTSGFQSGTISYENSRDRLPTAYEQENQVLSSVNYFDEKVDDTNWRQFGDSKTSDPPSYSRGLGNSNVSNMSSGIDDYQSHQQQRLYATSEIETWSNTGNYHK